MNFDGGSFIFIWQEATSHFAEQEKERERETTHTQKVK
jgi:hypothetical protein